MSTRDELPVEELLKDPIAVHLNMLRGGIAKLTPAQIGHLYRGDEACEVIAEVIRQNPEAADALQAQGCPKGWKLVPEEPTEAMLVAFHLAVGESAQQDPLGYYGEAYHDLIAAAPPPTLGDPG